MTRFSTMDSELYPCGCSIVRWSHSVQSVYFNEHDCNDVEVIPTLAVETVCSGPPPTAAPSTSNKPSAAPSTSNQPSAWTVPRYYKLPRGESCPDGQQVFLSDCLEAVRTLEGEDRTASHIHSTSSRISPCLCSVYTHATRSMAAPLWNTMDCSLVNSPSPSAYQAVCYGLGPPPPVPYHKLPAGEACPSDQRVSRDDCLAAANAIAGRTSGNFRVVARTSAPCHCSEMPNGLVRFNTRWCSSVRLSGPGLTAAQAICSGTAPSRGVDPNDSGAAGVRIPAVTQY